MYPFSATRTSTTSVHDAVSDRVDYTRNAAHRGDTFKGYGHLLEGTTLEEVLGQPDLHNIHAEIIRRALVDGQFPCQPNQSYESKFFAGWLVQHKQAKLLSLWLELIPLSIAVSTKETAAGLLAIMQSTLSFSGLTLDLTIDLQKDISKEVIPLVAQAFQANASLTKIRIFSGDYNAGGLSPLFDVLAEVAGLELITEGGTSDPTDCALLGTLLSRNKTLRALKLLRLGNGTFEHDKVAPRPGSVAAVIKHIADQLQLERLEISNVPPQCQAIIGELMCTSHVLKELKIGLGGTMVDPALISGFSQTSSVEGVHLSIVGLEDGILPLISSIADANTSIKILELRTLYPRVDRDDSRGICRLISSNRYLASLIWRLPEGCSVDLAQIGTALKKNSRLETVMLIAQAEADDCDQPDWINEMSISALALNLKKNHTLTELVLKSERQMRGPIKDNYCVLQQVLDRNSAFQRHACSDAFLYGAVEGFFATMDLPLDTANGTARPLMHYKPRTGAAALALINKASYVNAVFRRRQAQSSMLDRLLPLTGDLVINRRREMVVLLNGLTVNKGDFSSENILRIADSETLPGALVEIMFRSPHDYLYLVSLFCQAVGLHKMQFNLIKEIVKEPTIGVTALDRTGNAFILSMLELSFPPDQKHLLPFVEKELNYDFIKSVDVKLFVGYNIPEISSIGSNKAALASWCVESNQPGVLIAFHDACGSKVCINFKKYSSAFARSMMNKIPQLKKAYILVIEGIPSYEDALVLYRALAETSILEELHIDAGNCGPEFNFIMHGLSLNRSIKQLTLACRKLPDPPAICDTLASLLEANSTIEFIDIAHYDDDPELPELTQLAAMDERVNLEYVEHVEPDETSSDSDEAPVQ